MPQLDVTRGEARCVVLYHGPRRAGKTETFHALRHALPPERRGELATVASGVHPALYLEHLAVRPCTVGDLRVRLDLYGLPDHGALPLLGDLLRRADGVVFVADSTPAGLGPSREALAGLEDAFARSGVDPLALPLAVQGNKRDLPGALPAAALAATLHARRRPAASTVATTGQGVLVPLREVALQVLARLALHPAARPAGRRVALPSFQREPAPARRLRSAA